MNFWSYNRSVLESERMGGEDIMLKEIRIKAIIKGMKMKELAEKLGCSRELMYRKIKKKDPEFLKKIEKILK